MATGRGELLRSFLEGLEIQAQSTRGRRQPGKNGPGPGQVPGPGRGQGAGPLGGSSRRTRLKPSPNTDHSFPGEKTKVKCSPSKEVQRLPSEVLIKILSYLDASALICISHVSKLFHQLANDDVIWHKIYISEFGGKTWKPKSVDDVALKEEPVKLEEQSAGHWKKMYLRAVAGQEVNKWRRELRDIGPYTGLPRQTEWVLRNLNVSWELTLCDHLGQKSRSEPTRTYYFETSVIICWSGDSFPFYHHISSIQLHGLRKESPETPKLRTTDWRSLILKLDMKTSPAHLVGKDKLIKLLILSPGLIIGIWRGVNRVAFIMVSLHFYRLVERSLLGSPACSFSEAVDKPLVDSSDPEFGLHGYTLHFVLHNTGTEIMSGHFPHLFSSQIQKGLVELEAINKNNLSQHRTLSGSIKLPWKRDELEGSLENCCIMTLTLLDEFQKPFWCVSSPICIMSTRKPSSSDYIGEHFLMEYHDPDGQVKMMLVWLKEQKQFFLVSLIVSVPVFKVNKHFSTAYY